MRDASSLMGARDPVEEPFDLSEPCHRVVGHALDQDDVRRRLLVPVLDAKALHRSPDRARTERANRLVVAPETILPNAESDEPAFPPQLERRTLILDGADQRGRVNRPSSLSVGRVNEEDCGLHERSHRLKQARAI